MSDPQGYDSQTRLFLDHRDDGWWIIDRESELDDHGPYDTKVDAKDDRRGLTAFLKANP
jgi:hypothetical protein